MQEKYYSPIPQSVEKVGKAVLDATFRVHTALGPGLLESVYETCTSFELTQSSLLAPTQVVLPVTYKDIKMDAGLRLDMMVENCVIVEFKSVKT
jgi:GxxExxY protein